MELELGIDTVKQVELFGAARIAFDLPKDKGVNLRDYPTLRDVVQYIISNRGVVNGDVVLQAPLWNGPDIGLVQGKDLLFSKGEYSVAFIDAVQLYDSRT